MFMHSVHICLTGTFSRSEATSYFRRGSSVVRAALCVLCVGLAFSVTSSNCFAQQTPNIEREDEQPPASGTRGGTRTQPGTRGGTRTQPGSRGGGTRTQSGSRGGTRGAEAPRPAPPTLLDVVIITEKPATNVFLNGKALDVSGFDKRVEAKLAPDTYNIVTSGANQLVKVYSITISPDNTTFNLAQLTPTNRPKPTTTAAAATTTTTPIATATQNPDAPLASPATLEPPPAPIPAASVAAPAPVPAAPPIDALVNPEEVVTRYLDPTLTATITVSDWQKVEQVTTEALKSMPGNSKLNGFKLFAQGQLAYLRKDHALAAVLFNNAKLAVPDSALVFYGIGNNLIATNQAQAALTAYRRAVELNPQFALGVKGMGDAMVQLGKTNEALSYYDSARQLGYQSPNLNLEIARNHVKKERWQQAVDTLTPLAQTQPTAEIFVLLGDSYEGLKQPHSAMQAYLRATKIDDQSALGFYKYGEVMFDLREYAATAEAMERALALDTAGQFINRERAREYVVKANKALRKSRG